MLTLAFSLGLSDDGDYKGSTLVLGGRVDFGGGGVGGTGRFRRARGYSLTTKFGNPTPSAGDANDVM
uniref:Dirigent protein n=1 Tax=Oryza glumipatula TaxID=40148 RepID=A0A0D9Z8K4_9ORYZ